MARNGFCFLVDKLPKNIQINGHTLSLDTRTSTALSSILYLQNPNHTNLEKAQFVASRLLPDFSCHTLRDILEYTEATEEKLAGALFKYLHGYPEVKSWRELHADGAKTAENASGRKSNAIPTFDYVQDSDAIISAFRQVYRMNLEQVRDLHWWEFLALFNNLPDTTTFSAMRKIRSMKIDPKDSPERKAEIREAKRAIALKDTRSPEQKRLDLQSQLNNLEL